MAPRFNTFLRSALLASRWVMAPLCLGLIAALLILLAEFFRELAHAALSVPGMSGSEVILAVLRLIDLVLVANLVLMIIGAAVEIVAPAPSTLSEERPEWVGILDFAALKHKVFASISAIAAIDLLESFVNIDSVDKTGVLWEILMLLVFVVAGVSLAWMDRLSGDRH